MAAARHKEGRRPAAGAKVVPIRPALAREAEEEAARLARNRRLAALVARVAAGDTRALEQLYGACIGRVYAVAFRIVRVHEAAEEVAEDTFVQAWRTARTYDPARGGPLAWLLTIARSRALDHLRRDEPFEAHPDPDALRGAGEGAGDPLDLLAAFRDHRRLGEALRALQPGQRQLIALAFFRGLTHQEIAAQARLPLGTVKTSIRRGLATLRAALEPLD